MRIAVPIVITGSEIVIIVVQDGLVAALEVLVTKTRIGKVQKDTIELLAKALPYREQTAIRIKDDN